MNDDTTKNIAFLTAALHFEKTAKEQTFEKLPTDSYNYKNISGYETEKSEDLKTIRARNRLAAETVNDLLRFSEFGNKEHEDEILAMLEAGASPHETKTNDGMDFTSLHRAAEKGYDRIVRQLLSTGEIDVNAKKAPTWTTPLHDALSVPNNDRVIRLLLAAGADIDAGTPMGTTPIEYARNVSVPPGDHCDRYAAMIEEERVKRIKAACNRGTTQKRTIHRRSPVLKA
ncbi:MAG: ankyrin repeat domain-containing protein [Alphaproteobacteria bacterium]|nr:ankyrin repeat domain-containing protein [Alphaproteobacteria bacterium]